MNAFDEMNQLFREMNNLFDRVHRTRWSEWNERPALEGERRGLETCGSGHDGGRPTTQPGLESGARPAYGGGFGATATTLEDEGDEYVFVMDLPGFERADIDLTFADGTLSVWASRDDDEGTESRRATRSRRVAERVRVPAEIVADDVTASYRNGVLEVRLPVVADDRGESGHRIDID